MSTNPITFILYADEKSQISYSYILQLEPPFDKGKDLNALLRTMNFLMINIIHLLTYYL